jgi:hypothetical protein
MILGCPRSKYFFSDLPNLLPQKIRGNLFSLESITSEEVTFGETPQGTGSD